MALSDLLPVHGEVEPARVVDLVARKFNLTVEKLLGRDRTKEVAHPRQIAMYLLREEAKISFPQIGEVLGGRDHSTVMSAIEKIKQQIRSGDGRLQKDIDLLRHQLYDQVAVV
jgi:chromosomal replication initiator protein